MYVRMSHKKTQGKTYQYLQLCESSRNEKGQPRVRVLVNFGRLDQLDRKRIESAVQALVKYASSPLPSRIEELEHGRVLDYGDMLVLTHIWDRLDLSGSINQHLQGAKTGFDVAQMVKIMVLNRVSDPLSKLGILRWLETVHIPGTATEGVAYQHLLRAMDGLIAIKEEIEKDLYNQLINLFSPDVDLVFYDITSSYFEGDGPEIAAYGYSRDHRPDLKQIVIALAVTREGFPIFHEVLPGNTADVSTLADAVQTLSRRFKIRKTVIVCDRGMISQDNIEALEETKFPYILALRPRNNAEAELLYQKTLTGFSAEPSLNGLFIKETAKGGIRYIQCHNPDVAREKKTKRQERVAKIHKEITRLEKRYQRGELSEKDLHYRVLQTIEDRHMTPFFKPRIESGKVILYRDVEIWDREEYLDGKFILKTNLPPSQCTAAEAVLSYKQLQQVERAFRELKDFLKIRPVYHYTEERVKAHVFLCVLAYLVEKVVEQHCQGLPQVTSARRALSLLSRLKAIECLAGGRTVTVTNRVDKEITAILTALGVQPIKKML